jgi:hypothetical protein
VNDFKRDSGLGITRILGHSENMAKFHDCPG